MQIIDLGILDYRSAWQRQEVEHARVVAGGEAALLLVEHPPTITFGRRAADSAGHLVASHEQLAERGVEVVESDRGGDITFHGPGQLVAYPIVRISDYKLSVGGYVKALEHGVINALADFGLYGRLDPTAIGVWVDACPAGTSTASGSPAGGSTAGGVAGGGCLMSKVCALGVRIKAGVSMHGVALNVTTDLAFFDLIVPCGIADRSVTSLRQLLGERCPTMRTTKDVLSRRIVERFTP